MLTDKNLLILSFFGCLIPLFYYVKIPFQQDRASNRIVIGVLSNINNFERRKAIRATWKKMLPPDVHFSFVLGDTFCPYHQLWRLSDDNCNEWKIEVPTWLKEGESLSLIDTEKSQSKRNNKPYDGFSFRVMRFPIIFEGLGILTSALSSLLQDLNITRLTIDVRDRYTDEVVNSVTFNETDLIKKEMGFTFKDFRSKNLPIVDFDGVLSIRMDSGKNHRFSPNQCNAFYDQTLGRHGLVHINGLVDRKVQTILPFSKYSCSLVNLKYKILDVFSLKRHFRAKSTQNSVESQITNEFRKLLAREEEDFNDIIYHPVLDSKFNNSQKLKFYSRYIVDSVDFDHLILTDDSSFLFTNNIISKLEKMASSKLWWTDFEVFKRTGEFVENQVDKFTSLTYPPLAKAASMVLSRHHVQYLAQNLNYLKQFGSLQSSLGVWLSTIETKRHQDNFWNVKNCVNRTFTEDGILACSDLDPSQMRTLWTKLRKRRHTKV